MALHPHAERIPRSPATLPPDEAERPVAERPPASWPELAELARRGSATTWLSVPAEGVVHVRPLFAAWTGTSFVFASNPAAVKSRWLDEVGRCSLALDLEEAHLVVAGTVERLLGDIDLGRASEALQAVYGWPTTIEGDRLDAPYAAPSSGGPPFNAYEVTPTTAHAFPTDDQFEPTRFTFG